MLTISGRKVARIKVYDDKYTRCSNCDAQTIRFTVEQEYFHFFFLPVVPTSFKEIHGSCLTCGQRNGDRIKDDYLFKTRTPLYLYSVTLIFTGFIAVVLLLNVFWFRQETALIDDPKVGDVYQIQKETITSTFYYWSKIVAVNDDEISLINNMVHYDSIYSEMNEQDFFVKAETLAMHQKDVRKMYDDGNIVSIKRDYGRDSQFNVEF